VGSFKSLCTTDKFTLLPRYTKTGTLPWPWSIIIIWIIFFTSLSFSRSGNRDVFPRRSDVVWGESRPFSLCRSFLPIKPFSIVRVMATFSTMKFLQLDETRTYNILIIRAAESEGGVSSRQGKTRSNVTHFILILFAG